MGNPALISGGPGGRFARGENNGDTRKFAAKKLNKGAILKRLWKYLGKNRLLLVMALVFAITSSALQLYGPKLSGEALNAVASENGARMQAMDSATSNAEEMIQKLELDYNRARQGSITQELTEIIAGAQAIS